MRKILTCLSVLVLIFVAILFPGCRQYEVQSCRNQGLIRVDGRDDDWPKDSFYYLEEPRVFLAICNDDSFAYLLLRTNNTILIPELVQRGFVVWFDPKGGSDKALGIHYPLGMPKTGFADGRYGTENEGKQPGGDQSKTPPELRPRPADHGKFDPERIKMMMGSGREYEILSKTGDSKQVIRSDSASPSGIEIGTGIIKDNYLIYELRMPLRSNADNAYGINSADGQKYGLRLEMMRSVAGKVVLRPELPENRPEGAGMPGQGFPGDGLPGGAMYGDGMGKGPRLMSEEEMEFDFSIRVHLAPGSNINIK